MIKNIFLPTSLQGYYLFSQRIVGFEVNRRTVFATVIRAHRNKKFIQKFAEESYDHNLENSLEEAIKRILGKIGQYDQAYIALSGGSAIFKELQLPFASLEKIKLVLPMEIEPLLPFPLHQASVDAIVNVANKDTHESDLFVIAMKNLAIQNTINPFLQAGVRPSKVSLGILELYGFSQTIEEYRVTKGLGVLIDLDSAETRILLFTDKQIKTIRILPYGIDEDLMRLDLGVGKENLSKETQKFFSDIQFTIQATIKNENIQERLELLLLCGSGSQITDIAEFVSKLFEAECKQVQPRKIVHNGTVLIEPGTSIPQQFTTSLATALSSNITEHFNLGSAYKSEQELTLLKKQLSVVAILAFSILASFAVYSYLTTRSLRNELALSKDQVLQRLTREFNLAQPRGKRGKSLTQVINETRQKLTHEESIWFALSTVNRFSFLHYLQELGTHINRDKLGLIMKRLSIKSDERSGQDTVILEGSVRDYDALRKFEEDLQDSQLFRSVPKLQETKFNISLSIDKNGKGTT